MPDPLTLALNLPFQEQIDFFRAKLNLPTERWDDIWKGAHDRAFVVAGAMKADLLDDLRRAVSPLQRTTLELFRKDFNAIVSKHGWHGWTGEGTQAGEAWRTKVIFETNVRTSHAAGRYKQLTDPDTLAAMPYWRYVHNDSVMHPREEHLAWHGLTLPATHEFWQTHFAPNGWGCRCKIVAQRQPGKGDKAKPPAGWDKIDAKTGEQAGIDKGWGYTPGAMADEPLRNLVQQKLIKLPEAIGRALTRDINRYLTARTDVAGFARAALRNEAAGDLWLGFVDNPRIGQVAQANLDDYLVLLPQDAVRHVEIQHGKDGGSQRPPMPYDYSQAAEWLKNPDAVVSSQEHGPNGEARVKIVKRAGAETFESIWEIRPGRKNRALVLVSMWVKR